MGTLYKVEFGILHFNDVLPFCVDVMMTEARNKDEAGTAVKLFVAGRDPRYLSQPYVSVILLDVKRIVPKPYKGKLLTLVGGTSEAFGADSPPHKCFPADTCVIRQTASGVLEVAIIRYWHPNRLHWSGYRWHPQRKRWLPITRNPAEEIIGTPERVAAGRIRAMAEEAMKHWKK